MGIFTTQFTTQLGASNELINVTIEYGQDFDNDGFNDLKVTLSLDPSSNSGTDDLLGVAFDINSIYNPDALNLQILNIQRSEQSNTQSLSTFAPTSVIGEEKVTDNSNLVTGGNNLDPGFQVDGAEPFDIGIKFSEQGSGEGIVQTASFVISSSTQDLDETLLENTEWYVRLQSTDGGQESAKTGGVIGDITDNGGPANPAIDVEKYVSVDGGVTWEDADSVTGSEVLDGTNPLFKFVVTNTGDVALTNVNLTDSDFSLDGLTGDLTSGNNQYDIGTLAAGASTEVIFNSATWQSGQHANTATTSGTDGQTTVSDMDEAHYFGANPAIAIDKVTNGADGQEILAGTNVNWTYSVSNAGNVGISNVSVMDDNGTVNDTSDDFTPTYVSGDTDSDSILDVGETWTYQGNGTAQAGDYSNLGTVTGNYTDDLGNTENVTDDDPSNYFGADPSIDVEKYVSVDGGNTFVDADNPTGPLLTEGNGDPIFKFVVQNTGNVALTGVTLSDSDFALNLAPFDLAANDGVAGGADEFVYTFNGATWEAGPHTNTATVNATYTDDLGNQAPLTDSDDANYYGDALPEISVIKTASTTSIREDVGADVTYTVTITNNSDPNSADYDPVTITSLPDTLWIDNNGDGIQQTTEVQTVDRITDALADWQAAGNTGDIVLNPGEAFTFDYTTSYAPGELNPWEDPTNTIIANGTDDEGNQASDDDDAVVDVFQKNQRSIEIDSLTGIRNGDMLSGNFRIVNASGDPVDVKVDSLNMGYEEQVEGSKGNKKSWLPTELGYSNQFWIDSNPNGILDSNETLLTDRDPSTELFNTSIVFGSSVYVGYKSTFDGAVSDPIRATAEATIDGRFDRFGEKVTFHYTEVL
ncbi:MAG: hypothetical protein RID09_23340 [Coleofasciculus sp. G1-WW12-02]|uniref:DUF7507 domain-containing protein n=1 Tax=Coleofasciculus sp. G1-WW12-02 TaxID=3068483 RepID=UPI0032F56FD2